MSTNYSPPVRSKTGHRVDETGVGSGWPATFFHDETAYVGVISHPLSAGADSPARLPAPKTIQILDLGSKEVALAIPLPISIEPIGEELVARSYDLDLFAVGESESEAIDALRETIVEFYSALRGESKRSAYLTRKFEFLKSIVRCP